MTRVRDPILRTDNTWHGWTVSWAAPPFQIAIMHGMHAEATAALQIGRIDSSDCLTLAAEINETAAESNCASTIALAKNALARWSPLNQHLCLLRSTMHTTNSVLSQLPLAACAHA